MSDDRHVIVDGAMYNKTQLKLTGHGKMLHRDYTAHFFRWSFVRRLIAGHSSILDIGCGQELPLYNLLVAGVGGEYRPDRYVGVDLNKVSRKPVRPTVQIFDEFNFVNRHAEIIGPFDYIVCLEVIEHMTVESGKLLLEAIHTKMCTGSQLLLSTPVFNGKAAENHIHEYTIPELTNLIMSTGLRIKKRFGTFMNIPKLKLVTAAHQQLAEELTQYFDSDAVSCIMAPMYPDLARNNLWILEKENQAC